MPPRSVSLIVVATATASALVAVPVPPGALGAPEPPRQVRVGPDPAAALADWPRPVLRPGLSEPQIAAAIADHAKLLSDTGRFSGVVLAAHGDRIAVSRAYGLADVASRAPNTIDTRFNVGSIGKLFTIVAIAQLAEAGRLALDDTVRRHLPDLALPGADRITIQQLIDHASGLGDIFGPRFTAAPPARLRELSDFVPLFVDQPLAFEPGSQTRYSNAGYVVLGLIIERITGEKYRDHVARHVFARAGMTSTGLWAIDERVAARATGYRSVEGAAGRVPNTDTLSGRPSSAGGALSTAGDLLRFWTALSGGKLLSPRWTAWVLHGPPDGASRGWGFGGGAPGLNASLEVGQGWILIALANFDPPAALAVTRAAMDIVRGHPSDRAAAR
jgi:CubicO group peptidase (beta-lactamase class C family)